MNLQHGAIDEAEAKMAVFKYSKWPKRTRLCRIAAPNNNSWMTILINYPRFRVIALAVALWGALPQAVLAQAVPGGANNFVNNPNTTILDTPPPEGGWEGLAKLLEAVKPKTITALQPSPSQWTDNFERLLNTGRAKEALAAIEKREAQTKNTEKLNGVDVQLQFQHARALAALNRNAEAEAIYTQMTTLYPELPEPWNNLAILQSQRGDLQAAANSLQMALRADPKYTAARANLGDVQLMMAKQSFHEAGTPFPDAKSAAPSPAPTKDK
jgi:tetratricopeptide (TPR) repeat protein